MKTILIFLITIFLLVTFQMSAQTYDSKKILVRIAQIEVDTHHIDKYLALLKEEAEASVRLEPGVVAIYPMYEKNNPNLIHILEIYADTSAYKAHLESPHFLKYKNETLVMVKSLKLIDMQPLDLMTIQNIFTKLGQN